MNNRKILDDLEFENPVEIRKPDEKKPKKNWIVYLIILILIASNAYTFWKYYNFSQEKKQLNNKIKELEKSIKEKDVTLATINAKLDKMKNFYNNSDKSKSKLIEKINSLTKKTNEQNKSIKKLKSNVENLKKQLNKAQKKDKKLRLQISNLQKTVKEKEEEIVKRENTITLLNNKIKQQETTLKNLRQTFSMESSASKKLISELISEQKKNQSLLKKNQNLTQTIKELKKQIHRLKTVEEGDLVPASDSVILAKPLVNPSAKVKARGIFSRVNGFAIVNALIDEYGNVKQAYFIYTNVPKDKVDTGTIANKVLTTVKGWKFSPALYNGKVAVKTWQPVIIPVVSQ